VSTVTRKYELKQRRLDGDVTVRDVPHLVELLV